MATLTITPKPTPVGFTVKTHCAASHSESFLVADFGSIPPEINSARMYAGPGSDSLLAAAATWDRLAAELYDAARSHHTTAAELTGQSWLGPASATMMTATAPHLAWLTDTAALATRTAQQARAAAAAYEAARLMTVPPAVVAANRAQLAALATVNSLGMDTHAIAANEAQYREMWAQDSTAMYTYADASARAANVTPFLPPPGIADEAVTAQAPNRTAPSTIVHALQRLASPARITMKSETGRARMSVLALAKPIVPTGPITSPGLTAVTGTVARVAMTAHVGTASKVGALSTPGGWQTAASVSGSAAPALGAWSAAPISPTPAVPMMPTTRGAGPGIGSYVASSRPGLSTVIRMRSSCD